MAVTVSDILQNVAIYLGLGGVSDLTINAYDAGTFALNQARKYAERSHDFKYSETNVFLSIPSTGANYSGAYVNNSVTITGTLSPNVAGSFALAGTYNGQPFYTRTVTGTVYILSFDGTGWNIIAGGFTVGTDYWRLVTTSTNPSGAYTAHGAYTGTATAAIVTANVAIKRVKYVSLPIGSGDYEPVEFLTNDQFLNRVRMQVGRQNYNPNKTLANLGSTLLGNPLCYQNAQTLYLAPASLPFPLVAQLNIVQWMPDYTATTDTDFFCQYGTEFLMWQTVLELNKNVKWLTVRQEGSVDEDHTQAMRDAALSSLIAWDLGTEEGTTERSQQPQQPAAA